MTESWPAELRDQLLQLRAELMERVSKIKAVRAEGLEKDSAEQATQLESRDVQNALAEEGEKELMLISAALQRMEEGGYGICIDCGESIGLPRLKARPHSDRCIDCAS